MNCKIGVYICQCGSNISDYVDVDEVKKIVEKDKCVKLSKITMFACADSTQQEIISDIKEYELNAIVIASCSPKLHLFTFRNVAERAGLNPYNYVQVNIREQCSWAHSDNPKLATLKAIQLVKAGIEKAKNSVSLEPIMIEAKNSALIIGAGIAGMRAAIALANMGTRVILIEKEHYVGGRVAQWNKLYPTNMKSEDIIKALYHEIIVHDSIYLYTGAELTSKSGSVGNFIAKIRVKPRHFKSGYLVEECINKAIASCPVEYDDPFNYGLTKTKAIHLNHSGQFPEYPVIDMSQCTKCGNCKEICVDIDLEQQEEEVTVNVGAILLTTGADSYEPQKGEFGYEEIPNVITLQKFKRLIELCDDMLIYNNKVIKNIVYIYCVGARQYDGENQYCSRYCCSAAIHASLVLKEKFPYVHNFHLTRGVRAYGKQEILYNKSNNQNDLYFQFDDIPPEIVHNNGTITIKITDILTSRQSLEIDADLVVLVTAMVPNENDALESILKIPIGRDKFYNEIHPKLRPVETVIDGVLISGTCQAPLNVSETVKSALSAVAKMNSLISKGEIRLEPTLATIEKSTCVWCNACTDVCMCSAIKKTDYNGTPVAEVIKSNCKGCGMCLPVCPTNSIQLIGYSDVEIESIIDALAS